MQKLLVLIWSLGICLLVTTQKMAGHAAPAVVAQSPFLKFIQPTNNAIFSTLGAIPIVLRAAATNDVFLTAEVFVNQSKIATLSYCCPACDCALPQKGQETVLQFPVFSNGAAPSRFGKGWTNVQPGTYRLTARAVGENGTLAEATPVTITVLDRSLEIFVRSDGTVTLVIPFGSLVMGGYDLEASLDLRTWTRLGPFEPGNVAAFYFDNPPATARERRFYRSVFVPPRRP